MKNSRNNKRVLVTGANGQLGRTLEDSHTQFDQLEFTFLTKNELDITNNNEVKKYFTANNFDFIVNCAAYTKVEAAEVEAEEAFAVNSLAVEILGKNCKEHDVTLIHISTDFVFNGLSKTPYTEGDTTAPINVYGSTKRKGELVIQEVMKEYYIIRTSWLYSEYAFNFMKTMIHLSQEKDQINVVNDQEGTPTYAKDLAKVILKLIERKSHNFGIYHYSNEGVTTWYGFADQIFSYLNCDIQLKPISSKYFKTDAERPKFSVLDKGKIKGYLQINIPTWQESLKECLTNYSF